MSTLAEQVVEQLKTDMDNVYDAGYQRGLKEVGGLDVSKFGIQNEVTGTGIVTLDYVNENEHNVGVKLSSDTVTDFSGVEVKCVGENVLDKTKLLDGYIKADGTVEVVAWYKCTDYIPVNPNDALYVWNTFKDTGTLRFVAVYDKNKTFVKNLGYQGASDVTPVKYDIDEGVYYIRFNVSPSYVDIVMATLNAPPTEYRPYTEKTYTANADGTVDGVTSISPTMNIICEGVDISAKYYFIAERNRKPDYCTKVDYQFNNLNVFGKKEIEITEDKINVGTNLFYQGVLNTTVEHITVNSNSNTIQIYQMFLCVTNPSDTTLKHITLNFDINGNNNSYAFNGLSALEVIDGKPLNLIKSNASYMISNMFGSCINLKEVRFVPNTIVYSISFAYSALLSDDTINSIIDGLADMTGKTAMVLTLHAEVKAKLTEEQIASITAKNWTLA